MSRIATIAFAVLAVSVTACQSTPESASGDPKAQARASIDRHAQETITRLRAEQADAGKELDAAAGYAVFDLSSVNVVMVVGQRGKGVMVDGKTQARTYMKAIRAGTGPGLGYQQLRQIFVFKNTTAMDQFKVGDTAGGDVSASATVGTGNIQRSFNPYITTYQLTEKGFAVQANWGGTAYLVDPDLN